MRSYGGLTAHPARSEYGEPTAPLVTAVVTLLILSDVGVYTQYYPGSVTQRNNLQSLELRVARILPIYTEATDVRPVPQLS